MSVELTIETVTETVVLEVQDHVPAIVTIDTIPELREELDDKVDKVAGLGLSELSFTTADKNSLNQSEQDRHTHANKSVIDDLSDNAGALEYRGLPVSDQAALDAKVDKVAGYSLVADDEIAKLLTVEQDATSNRDDSENADKVHTHAISDVTGLSERLSDIDVLIGDVDGQVTLQNRKASYPWLSSLLVVGDSRASEGCYQWKTGSASTSTLNLRDVRGGYLNAENQSGTLEYDYRDEDPHVRWKALGDSFGPWTPVHAGLNYVESGTAGDGYRLRFALYSTDTLPAGTETASILLTGNPKYGYAAIGCINRALHILRWPFARVRNVAIGGNSSGSVLPQIETMRWEASGSGGAAIVMLGTNDISGVTALETITQNLAELYDSLAGLGLRLIIIEEHARWGSSAVSPMSVGQLERFNGVRAFQRKYAHKNGHLFVATYDATKDPAHSDGRPKSGVLRDTVHPSEYGSALIGGLIAEKVSSWVGLGPVARETDPNQLSIGYFKSGGGSLGAGVTGVVPSGWSLRRSLGSDAVAVASLEDKDGPLKWLRCLMSATTAGRILLSQYFEAITLEELELSLGDKIYAELEYRYRDVVNVTHVEVLFRFAGQPSTTELVPFTSVSGPILDESGIYRSPVVAIPDATTGINLYLTVRLDSEGSADISFANIAIRKYLL